MEKISSFFRNFPEPRKHATERGDLMDFFISHVNPSRIKIGLLPMTFARMGKELEGIPTKSLYTIKSSMDDGMRRSIPGGAAFWTALRSISRSREWNPTPIQIKSSRTDHLAMLVELAIHS